MDKEALKKNQFWYLFGGFVLVWLILWACSLASGSDLGEKNRKEQPEKKKSLTDWNNKKPKNEKFIKPWDDYRKEFAAQKDTVWNKAWDTQASFYVWPRNPDGTDFNQVMLYAEDSKSLSLRKREEYQRIYTQQFKDLDKLVAPAYFNGDERVASRGGPSPGPGRNGGDSQGSGFNVIMGPTTTSGEATGNLRGPGGGGPRTPRDSGTGAAVGGSGSGNEGVSFTTVLAAKENLAAPTPEEIWILQEDFWVKQEMLHIIQAVQQSVGHFAKVEVSKDESKPSGVSPEATVKRYSNGVWEFTFYIEQPKDASLPVISAKSTIKNISPSHAVQPLSAARGPLEFNLMQGGVHYQLLVSGEPLPWNVPYPIGRRAPDNLRLDKDFDLEQKFDWSNAPVRRIDALRTAKQSHRTAKKPLEPNPIFKSTDATTPGAAPAAPPAPPGPGGASPGPGGASPGPGGALLPAGPSSATPYLLDRNRYLMATEQARHLPIAMVLVVEPTHINDVLIAVANSPLRIQTTQVAFHEVSVARPADPKDDADKRPMGGPTNPNLPPGQTGARNEDVDNNLVELTVYGIATLYERPKKKDEPKPANQTPPLTPPKPMPMPTPPPAKP